MTGRPDAGGVRELIACVGTHRFEETLAFYTDVLGGTVRSPATDAVAFRHAVVTIGTGLVEVLELPADRPVRPDDSVTVVLGVDDVPAWHDAMAAAGVDIAFPVVEMEPGRHTFAVRDPNGVRVSFFTVAGP